MAKLKRVVRYTDSNMGIQSIMDYYTPNLSVATYKDAESVSLGRSVDTVGKLYKIIVTVQEIS